MIYALTLVAPLALLVLMLVMERVERPLCRDDVGEQLVGFLETARAEEVETFVSEGFGPALDRYWRRRRAQRILAARRMAFDRTVLARRGRSRERTRAAELSLPS